MIKTPLFIVLIAVGCATKSLNLSPEALYKREARMRINGTSFVGVASVPQRPEHRIVIETPQKPLLLKIATCHREFTVKKPGKRYEYLYKPVPREMLPPCPLSIAALDLEGANSWALIDFKASGEQLEARIGCNGDIYRAVGSALCQARIGLIQTITFEGKVWGKAPERCPELIDLEGGVFEYSIDDGLCQYLFTDGREFFRLLSAGYNEVLISD